MSSKIKIKLNNRSGIPLVRFIGVHFDGVQFSHDVADGDTINISNVKNGSIGLTAYRTSDQLALDTLSYGVSESQGFAAVLLNDEDTPAWPYKLVGEGFQIPDCS